VSSHCTSTQKGKQLDDLLVLSSTKKMTIQRSCKAYRSKGLGERKRGGTLHTYRTRAGGRSKRAADDSFFSRGEKRGQKRRKGNGAMGKYRIPSSQRKGHWQVGYVENVRRDAWGRQRKRRGKNATRTNWRREAMEPDLGTKGNYN